MSDLQNAHGVFPEKEQMQAVIAPGAEPEVLARGYSWAEGPVWDSAYNRLFFSDVPRNRLMVWSRESGAEVYLTPSGTAVPVGEDVHSPGSNGLAMDGRGNLIICQHGDRQVIQYHSLWRREVLASHYKGKLLNSPNDVAIHPSGDIYFTDPYFGLKGGKDDPACELEFSGVYRITPAGELHLVADELLPNGLAFAPDGETLYITDVKRVVKCHRKPDGSLTARQLFFTMPETESEDSQFDGLTVTNNGYLLACNWHSGIFVVSPEGAHVGTIRSGNHNANCTIGGPEGRTLFVTAQNRIVAWPLAAEAAVKVSSPEPVYPPGPQRAADEVAIRQLLSQYCHRIDNTTGEAVGNLFHPEGKLELSFTPQRKQMDREAASEWFASWQAGRNKDVFHPRHSIANPVIRFTSEDRAEVSVEIWAHDVREHDSQMVATLHAGFYQDEVMKWQGRWWFWIKRIHIAHYHRVNDTELLLPRTADYL